MRPAMTVAVAAVSLLVGCGGGGAATGAADDAGDATAPTPTVTDTAVTVAAATGLPAECVAAPFTVVALRDGEQPAGSTTYGVVGSAALPIPLVPNKSATIPAAQVTEDGATTDLLGYVLFFGDESFGPGDVSMFGGYAPAAAGHSRGTISIFPSTTTPLAVGDRLAPGQLDGLDMTTTLNRVNLDFKATPDELTSYLDSITGAVTVLGLTDGALCLDVDLAWKYSDFSSTPAGTLTVQGIFSAPLAPRTLPFT